MASDLDPPPNFNDAALDLTTVARGEMFGRIYFEGFPDPLGFGKSPSRFSDPRRRIADNRFGVLYLGQSVQVCFLEAVLRDARNGQVEDYLIDMKELTRRRYARLTVTSPLRLVDLRGAGPIRMGIPSDVARGTAQVLARRWSVALHDHPDQPDGILYPSRLSEEINLAVYDRAVGKLGKPVVTPLLKAPGFPRVLNDLRVAIAP